MENILEVNGLCKNYGSKQILKSVNITIEKGQIYGLVGKNGVGKTTLMKIVTGLSFATSGDVTLFGESSNHGLEKTRRRLGTIIETPSFFPYMTAEKNLEYYRIQRGITDKNIVKQVLEEVGLSNTGTKKFKNFSLGMKQRLGLALALMNHPDFLILDEPINGLDPQGIVEIRNLLLKLNKENKVTILISSHILGELASVANFYGFMKDGEMVEQISAADLEAKCKACLDIVVSDTNQVASLLERELQCNAYEVLPDNRIRIYDYLDRPSVISDLVVLNGVKLSLLEVKSMDLENYFLDLLGGE